ncbi:MAG: RNA methyltransferase [Clostridia bacterium]|nr:RNA methyltransferase [Clostridia bacterium]
MDNIFLALVHYPVYNKNMDVISTSITNLDIHDIARTVATYGLVRYYIVHPHKAQGEIAQEIISYWQEGYGSVYNPDRKTALDRVVIKESIQDVITDITLFNGKKVKTIVTDARIFPNSTGYLELRERIASSPDCNFLLLFGTGYGLAKEIMDNADYRLYPIMGNGDYNHLSVRSAVSIILDRLCGEKWW